MGMVEVNQNTVKFLQEIIGDNRQILNVITSNYTK